MATLSNYIRLVDGVSGPLRSMTRNAQGAQGAIGGVGPALNSIGNATSSISRASGALASLANVARSAIGVIGSFGLGTMLGNYAMQAIDTLKAIPGQLVGISAGYAGIQARLGLLTGSQAKVKELNEEIYQSALRSRGSFESMADAVTKIGMTAKEAFPDPSEVVPFMEGIQKLFVIGGTDKSHQQDALLQLTQALGSGKLQGDEFRSIAEAAPLIEQMVAKYMGVTQGTLKELSSKGEITSEVMKNAILANMDEINRQFAAMPMTFDQHMQRLETIAYNAFTPVFDLINEFMASPIFTELMNSIAVGITILAQAITGGLNLMKSFFAGVANNLLWLKNSILGASTTITDILVPALAFVVGFLGALGIMWLVVNAGMLAHAAISEIVALAEGSASIATAIWTVVTGALATAINFCTGGIGLFLAVVLGIPIVIATIIGGFLAWRVATNGVRDTFVSAFTAIGEIIDAVVVQATSAINGLIDVMNSAAKGINNTFGWAGANIKMTGHVSVADLGGNTHAARYRQWAADTYDSVANKAHDLFNPKIDVPSISTAGGGGGGAGGGDFDPSGALKGNTGRTAANTGRMADSLDLLDEEIKDMKYATQEQINRYTNTRVTIDVGGISQNISSDVDVDGVIDRFVERLQDSMASGAEAAYGI